MKNNISNAISQTEVFKNLREQDVSLLSRYFHQEFFKKGDVVIKEGEQGGSLSIVTSGVLNVILDDNENVQRFSKIILNTLLEGDVFGEYSLIDQRPTSASIIAEESGQLLKITKADFQKIIASNPLIAKTVYYNMLKLSISRLRNHDEELDMFT